ESSFYYFFFSSRRRHTRSDRDWSSDVCSSDLITLRDYRSWCAAFPQRGWYRRECCAPRPVVPQRDTRAVPTAMPRYRPVDGGWRSEERRVGKEGRARWGRGKVRTMEGDECMAI